jgi:sugar/nucleoside kinase (ribokinase family)
MPDNQKFDILGLGAVAVDDLLYVDEYPPAESKVRVCRRQRQCGGLTGTALVAAARLGARCAYGGRLGNDELSQFVIERMGREGVDLSVRAVRPDARPAHSTIVVDQRNKTRTIFAYLESDLGPDPHEPAAEVIRAARVLLLDHHGLEGSIRAARIARESGIPVVADVERDPGGPFNELLALIDHLVISERFARQLTGADNPRDATARLLCGDRRVAVVTCGAAGSWHAEKDILELPRHCPALAVEVADTTGCGDVFHGAYCAALAEGRTLAERVIFATAAAALKAAQPGGQAGCPTRRAVEEFLAARPEGVLRPDCS